MTDHNNLTEAERLIVAVRRVHNLPADQYVAGSGCGFGMTPPFADLLRLGDKLIAQIEPKLLTAEEANAVYMKGAPGLTVGESLSAVLDACLDRAMRVIEALPAFQHKNTDMNGRLTGDRTGYDGARSLDDIRRALRPGAAS